MHTLDMAIVVVYLAVMIAVGWVVAKWAARSSESYFLAGKSLPWWIIGIAHGSSGIDITGTMWFVMMLYVYGVKAVWLLWVWPLFNVLFRMMYLGVWVRRSNVLTGAEWMRTRFGYGWGAELGYLSVVLYALVSVVGFLSYAFRGIGQFCVPYLPWGEMIALPAWLGGSTVPTADVYATVILVITGIYCVMGGMYSVVLNDLIQFSLIVVAALVVAGVAIAQTTPDQIAASVPDGWDSLFFGRQIDHHWAQQGLPALDARIRAPVSQGGDGYALFGFFVSMLFLKGVFVSMAGPTPNYAIQHILSTRSPREAALENLVMCVASLLPRFLFIGGVTVIAIVFFKPDLQGALNRVEVEQTAKLQAQAAQDGEPLEVKLQKTQLKTARTEIEGVLPKVIQGGSRVPVGCKGLILAGLLAAFMSTFVSTVNSGAAYVVNDIYKRYFHPDAAPRRLVLLGYLTSIAVIVLGILFGYATQGVHSITEWIVSGLVPAFVAPNVLKWHWWRFNGFGFFAGMVAGTAAALVLPPLVPGIHPVSLFWSILAMSTAASVIGCLLTRPDREETLKSFYRTVRPWGWWRPVYEKLREELPALERNRDLPRDVFNLAIGLVWQTAMVALPIYVVLQQWGRAALCLAVFAVTSVVLKFTWFDRLGPGEMYMPEDR